MTINKEQAVSDAIARVEESIRISQGGWKPSSHTMCEVADLRTILSAIASHPLEQQQAVSGDVVERADRMMREFYVSPFYDPKAGRPADNVKAAIHFALTASGVERMRAGIAERATEGDGFWRACTGCHESVDGCVSIKDYPFDPMFQCQSGGGCRECGGIGVVWDNIDYADFARTALQGGE